MNEILKLAVASVFSGAVVAAIVSVIFKRKTEEIAAEIKNQFELLSLSQKSGHAWKEKAIAELFGPLNFELKRTKKAFHRYKGENIFLETQVLKQGNERIRNLLLNQSYLVPPDLMEDSYKLIEHYDVWLEQFALFRETENPTEVQKFIFAGPKGFPFPKEAEIRFQEKYIELWKNLYETK